MSDSTEPAPVASTRDTAGGTGVLPRSDLVGVRVTLRPNRGEFAPQLFAGARESVDTVGRWMPWCHPDYALSEATDWMHHCENNWAAGAEYEFSIFDRAGTYVGGCGLNTLNRNFNFANLGYWIRQSRQGDGLSVEAVRVLSAFGFDVLKLTRIEIVAAWDNGPSRRVAEKTGATFEGRLRNRLLIRGVPVDAAMYSLIPPDRAASAHRQ